MTRRKLRYKWPKWARRGERKYDTSAELHAYEDSIIIPLIRERGAASVADWTNKEPGRWRPRQLSKALRRLERAGVLDTNRRLRFEVGARRHYTVVYTLRKEERKAA